MAVHVLLEGTAGFFLEERHLVAEGTRVVVGRSRSCDVSAARTREAREKGRALLEGMQAFRRISRKHFALSFVDGRIELEDLSANGIRVGDNVVSRATFTLHDVLDEPVQIVFGEREGVRVRVVEEREPVGEGSSG